MRAQKNFFYRAVQSCRLTYKANPLFTASLPAAKQGPAALGAFSLFIFRVRLFVAHNISIPDGGSS